MDEPRDRNKLARVGADGISASFRADAAFRTKVSIVVMILAVIGIVVLVKFLTLILPLASNPAS